MKNWSTYFDPRIFMHNKHNKQEDFKKFFVSVVKTSQKFDLKMNQDIWLANNFCKRESEGCHVGDFTTNFC